MVIEAQIDPQSLVARIVAELQANPEAQRMLLQVLLTNEFMGMPARLDRIEKDIAEIKGDVAGLKNNVAFLRGSELENRLHRKVRPLLSQSLQLREPSIMQSQLQEPQAEFAAEIRNALNSGLISDAQDNRIITTDFILRALRRSNSAPLMIAVEASNKIDAHDIQRARESADILAVVFGIETLPVVAGYSIDPPDRERAVAAGVYYLEAREDF